MTRLPAMTCHDVVRRLRRAAFVFERQAKGSHEIWYNPQTKRRTTVPCHPGALPMGTTRAIIRAAGLSVEEFLASPQPPDRARGT